MMADDFSSNKRLLQVLSLSFFLFVVAEIVGAIYSESLSLLGDAAAMSVDVVSYFTNMYAEHVKEVSGLATLSLRMRVLLEVSLLL